MLWEAMECFNYSPPLVCVWGIPVSLAAELVVMTVFGVCGLFVDPCWQGLELCGLFSALWYAVALLAV